MRVRIWNAYSSNNSGSYVIVGNFTDAEVARKLATELSEVCIAHSAWLDEARSTESEQRDPGPSPLGDYAKTQDLPAYASAGQGDDWPQHGAQDWPDVWSVGSQVLIHSDYTVTLPAFFGALIYARGGSVVSVENHAHDVLVTRVSIYWDWRKRDEVAHQPDALFAALLADDGLLARYATASCPPAWKRQRQAYAHIELAAVFDDLVAATEALRLLVEEYEAISHVRIHEAMDRRDPVAFMRPCEPPDHGGRARILIEDLGASKAGVREILWELGVKEKVPAMPEKPIVVFPQGGHGRRVRWEAERLRAAGATLEVQAVASPPGRPHPR